MTSQTSSACRRKGSSPGHLVEVEEAAEGVADAPQAEAVLGILGPVEAAQEAPGLAQHLQGAQVPGEVVVVDPVVDEGVGGAGLVAEVVGAVAVAAAHEVGAEGVPVAGVDVDGVAGHGLAEVEPLRRAGPQVLDPDAVARVPLAVAPAPAAGEAPVAAGLVPGHEGVAVVEEAVPAADLDLPPHPLHEAGEHAVRAREGAAGRGEPPVARHRARWPGSTAAWGGFSRPRRLPTAFSESPGANQAAKISVVRAAPVPSE